jgi:beta-N-acetylhexosaminidase
MRETGRFCGSVVTWYTIIQISRWGDGVRATHFPGAMALGATRSPSQAFDVAKATAKELAAVGINWNFAPVLDVLDDDGNTSASVRAFGDDPQVVAQYGVAFAEGLRAGGVGHCAKHFPGMAPPQNARRREAPAPTKGDIAETDFVPFRRAIGAGLDSVMLSSSIWPGGGLEEDDGDLHALRAKYLIGDVLRRQLAYDGVTVCDVTDMPLFAKDRTRIGEAVLTAVESGCDIILIYHNPTVTIQGIEALYEALSCERLSTEAIFRPSRLILRLKEHYFSWRTALAGPDPQRLTELMLQHQTISRKAYENSITIVRDERTLIPLSSKLQPHDQILLLTPVVKPLHQRAPNEPTIDPFECFGRELARRHRHIVHAPYTAHGVTQTHVALIKRASAVIFVTVNATRPNAKSQIETAGAVHRLCYNKPIINVSACDPYDLLDDKTCLQPPSSPPIPLPLSSIPVSKETKDADSILGSDGTYICTYEYSPPALSTAAAFIFGERPATGILPVRPLLSRDTQAKQRHVSPAPSPASGAQC